MCYSMHVTNSVYKPSCISYMCMWGVHVCARVHASTHHKGHLPTRRDLHSLLSAAAAAAAATAWLLSHVRLSVAPRTIVHQAPLPMGILQARILEWAAISFSRGSS